MDQFKRPISPNEALYRAGTKVAPPFALQVFVEGMGKISLENLKEAVEVASRACPGTRLVASGKDWIETELSPPVIDLGHLPIEGFDINLNLELKKILDLIKGPTCEVLFLQDDLRTLLVFRASHCVMDGKGILFWASEVFRVLRGETPLGAGSSEVDIDFINKFSVQKEVRPIQLDSPSPFLSIPTNGRYYFWARRTFKGSHPGIVAQVAKELAGLGKREPIRAMIPVDLRPLSQDVQSTANLSLPIFLELRPDESWELIQARILEALSSRSYLCHDHSEWLVSKALLPFLTAGIQFAVALQVRRGRYLASATLSHLGRLDLATVSTPSFRASTVFSLPVHTALVPISLTVVELLEHTEIVLSCAEGEGMREEVDAFLDHVVRQVTRRGVASTSHGWIEGDRRPQYPLDQTVSQLLGAQVRRTPEACAIRFGGETFTYAEFDQRVHSAARRLIEIGVLPGDVVGLIGERTPTVIIAIFAILRAGAAYLPIDPLHPNPRVKFILEDSGVKLCLAGQTHQRRVKSLFSGRVESPDHLKSPSPEVISEELAGSHSLAYVIYTSGSTGQPKGTLIEHRSLVNYSFWASEAYATGQALHFALFTSLSFDLTITSLFVPLLSGGTASLFPSELNHLILQEILSDNAVNALKLTPTHLEILTQLGISSSHQLRTIVVGGSQLTRHLAVQTQKLFGPQCRIINEYGPTETTVGCVWHVFDEHTDLQSIVPIGIPSANTEIVILTPDGSPTPRGELGELYIGGEGVARGYLNREDLTHEKFVTIFGSKKAYRTGDFVRVRSNGDLEFKGRMDTQIKIRGHRVEPAEIEAEVLRVPGIQQAIVLGYPVHESNPSDQMLVAYYVASAQVSESQLRESLSAGLPGYMVPQELIQIPEIPLTLNGKVANDRLPLPRRDVTASINSTPPSPGEQSVEATVAHVWARVLRVDPKDLTEYSNFYGLGGDSLKMIQMLADLFPSSSAGHPGNLQELLTSILTDPTLGNVCHAVRKQQV